MVKLPVVSGEKNSWSARTFSSASIHLKTGGTYWNMQSRPNEIGSNEILQSWIYTTVIEKQLDKEDQLQNVSITLHIILKI